MVFSNGLLLLVKFHYLEEKYVTGRIPVQYI